MSEVFAESALRNELAGLDFTQLCLFTEKLAEEIEFYSRQGATDEQWTDAQAFSVGEEGGEFVGAYRRWKGFARRPGTKEELCEELSDVVISAFIMFSRLDEDAMLHIKRKLGKVITRGYVNKA